MARIRLDDRDRPSLGDVQVVAVRRAGHRPGARVRMHGDQLVQDPFRPALRRGGERRGQGETQPRGQEHGPERRAQVGGGNGVFFIGFSPRFQ